MTPQPFALEIETTPDLAFDLADALGMDGKMTALSVTLCDAPNDLMLVQALYTEKAEAIAVLESLGRKGHIRQLPETDWVSVTQAALPPVNAGRFCVYGSHDADRVKSDKVSILVEAGLAFGTGHHGTTAGCLEIFSRLLDDGFKPGTVLDLGCGAGVLAIAAAKTLANAPILATDIDPDAITVTIANADENGVGDRVQALVADGFDSPALSGRQFDLVFANILAGPLMELADDIAKSTAYDGHVILSGILDEKAETVAERFRKAGLDVSPQPSLDGWTSLLARKPA